MPKVLSNRKQFRNVLLLLLAVLMKCEQVASVECYICSWNPNDHQLEDDRCSSEHFDPTRTQTITCTNGCEIVTVRDTNGALEMFYRNCKAATTEITNEFKKRTSQIVQEEVLTCDTNYCNKTTFARTNLFLVIAVLTIGLLLTLRTNCLTFL